MSPSILGVRSYSVFLVVGIVIGGAAMLVTGTRAGVPWRRMAAIQLLLLLGTLAGARAFILWESGYGYTPWVLPLELGALRYPGGVLALIVVLPLIAHVFQVPITALGDIVAIPAALAMGCVRVGCLLHGCCFGTISHLPWAVSFPRHSIPWAEHVSNNLILASAPRSLPVHPLQIYFGLWSLAVAVLLFRFQSRARYSGQILLLFLVFHDGGKALLESLREPRQPDLQLASVAVALLAACLLVAGALRGRIRRGVA